MPKMDLKSVPERKGSIYPDVSLDEEGMRRLFRQFSFPGGIPSHASPETPGSIHEGTRRGLLARDRRNDASGIGWKQAHSFEPDQSDPSKPRAFASFSLCLGGR
jgi:hypothetical protein